MNLSEKFVQGEGPLDTKIALVGEAPGYEEAVQGRPFVGPSGYLLNRCLQSAGIIREYCYLTNVKKTKPVNNDIKTFIDLKKKYPIESDVYKESVEYLRKELEKCKANVIVAVGAIPLWALCGLKTVTKRRGSIYESTLLPGRKVIPMIHPAAALRLNIYTNHIIFDLKRIREQSKFPEIRSYERELTVNPEVNLINYWITELSTSKKIAFDIEVINEEVSCISLSNSETGQSAISIPFGDNMTAEWEMRIMGGIGWLLESPNIIKVGQNLTFDSTFLFRKYGIRCTNMRDTMVAQAIINPDYPKALDFIVSIYTNEPYYKDDLKKYSATEYKKYEDDITFWEYNAKDSAVCMEALPKMYTDLEVYDNKEVFEKKCRLIEPLVYMAEKGIRVDKGGMKEAGVKIEQEVNGLQEQLNIIAGKELNPNSHKQMKEYFYVKKGIKPYKSRAKGRGGSVTVDEKALKRIAIKGFKEAKIIIKIRKLKKIKSTYLDAIISDDERIRCSFNPVGGDGRISSSANIFDEGTNMQNWPHPLLRFLLADEGYIIYNVDLEQADSRVVAYIAPEPTMILAFENNEDIHTISAAGIWNKNIEDITSDEGECPLCDDPDICGHEGERFWGKKAGHSFNYLLGYRQFSYLFEIPERESKLIRMGYLKTYPGLQTMWNWQQTELHNGRVLTDCYGWTRRFVERWGPELFKQASSFIPRSTVASKINFDGILNIWDDSSLNKVELLNQVHDSVVVQIPIKVGWAYHEKALKKIKEYIEKPIIWKGREFVIPASVSMGLNLRDTVEVKEITKNNIRRSYEHFIKTCGIS